MANSQHFSEHDVRYMQLAIDLAKRGIYSTQPNPAVGCVLVKDDSLIGQGFHKKAGQPHAERMALADAKQNGFAERLKGATAYVTLEPCSHFGRTPPCADGLIESGVARVVVAMMDPNPLVSGQGVARLQEAGIEVLVGVLEEQAEQLNLGFCKRMRHQQPYVRLKTASSLDGRTALNNGQSQWITGEAARQQVHKLRAQAGALITGIGTVLADDPSLNVRLSAEWLDQQGLDADNTQPLRVVLDTQLQMPIDAKMLGLEGRTLIVCAQQAWQQSEKRQALIDAGAEVIAIEQAEAATSLSLPALLHYLAEQKQINDVLVECGAELAGSFIDADLVDEWHCFIAPCVLGNQARALLNLPEMHSMSEKREFEFIDIRMFADDIGCVLKPKPAV